ncbi:prostaglandin E2 receptor EP4 subtype [Anopheles arabiensis]|uniref:G-protein coupled receptors family 1 profile domain-containing protein n=1 Tax=Anopheles arabiensis TaxID=7173 RepID=A0A182HL82_ANOAR|nr:prostaglandin E2 receptor EP4 subtype [Anopheles arabiensis]
MASHSFLPGVSVNGTVLTNYTQLAAAAAAALATTISNGTEAGELAAGNRTQPKSGPSLTTPCMVIVMLSYIFGCVGNLMALIHLWRNVRNTKHALMLKCLLTNDLIGLSGMFVQMCLHLYLSPDVVQANIHNLCVLRVIWRVFGISSGCVAFVMALERYIALAKPFFYHKYVTDKLIRKSIFILWGIGAFITFLPLFGFGVYFDERKQTCVRYRSATEPIDVAYAYLFFAVGTLLCVGIVICNLSVRKVLYQSHRKMCRQFGSIKPTPMLNRSMSQTPKSSSFTDSNIIRMFNEPTTEEIRFAKLMTVLSVFFIICWLPQMISIILLQQLSAAMKLKLSWVFRVSDILILVHFMLDPYIYVLLKKSRRSDLRTMIRYMFSRNQRFNMVDAALSPMQKSTNSSPLP